LTRTSARFAERLQTQQTIFGSQRVCIPLRANGTFNGPTDPERRVMRCEIGCQVMSYADNHQMTDGEITQAVVDRMSITYQFEPGLRAR